MLLKTIRTANRSGSYCIQPDPSRMKRNTSSLLWRTVGVAALAGARTMAAPALVSHALKRRPTRRLGRSRFATMQSSRTAKVLTVLAAGEMVGDKLPTTPARISPPALIGRGLSGALVGAALFARRRDNSWRGATVGTLSALVGAYATYHLRKRLGELTPVPDPVWGGVEDLLVVKTGQRLLS